MTRRPIAIALLYLLLAAPAALAESIDLYDLKHLPAPVVRYNPQTGNATFTHFAVGMGGQPPAGYLRLELSSGAFIVDKALRPVPGRVDWGWTMQSISWIALPMGFTNPFNGGDVIPAGTPRDALTFTYRYGGQLDFATGAIAKVPEPPVIVLFAIGLGVIAVSGANRRLGVGSSSSCSELNAYIR